jgi:hypothetical protein
MANYRGLPATACDHCGEIVLRGASRCKNCFESLGEVKRHGIWGIAVLNVLLVAVLFLGIRAWKNVPPQINVITDQETQSIVIVRKFSKERFEADRIHFGEIKHIESVASENFLTGSSWSVAVLDNTGARYELNTSSKGTLDGYAQQIADVTGKPLERVDKQRHSDLLGPVDQ